jgi:hypothetical protein
MVHDGEHRASQTRRAFLGATIAAGAGGLMEVNGDRAAGAVRRPKVAAIFTEFTRRSHAHVLLENFLEQYLFNGKATDPGVDVVSFFGDQEPSHDMARGVAQAYGIERYPTIAGALCRGGERLAVDAVLLIAEFGQYPRNEKGQLEYPRKRFFDEMVAVFRRSGRVVPVFSDKHLSFRWDWAREMYDTAVELKIPFMAGSSVPLAQRRPAWDLPKNARISEALSLHGGPFEIYDFHSLEVLQSVVEARRGGEAGVRSVRFLDNAALWKAADEGVWSPALADAIIEKELGPGQPPIREFIKQGGRQEPWGILLDYYDGLKATVLRVGPDDMRWGFACRLAGSPEIHAVSHYVGPWQNRCLFKALSHAIQVHFRTAKAPYPVERTLLATGALEAAVDSRHQGGKTLETPHLRIPYRSPDWRALRETGETWKILTESLPEPPGIEPGGLPRRVRFDGVQ